MKGKYLTLLVLLVFVAIAITLLAGYATRQTVIKNITVQEAFNLIQQNESNGNFVILDVRTPQEFAEGHLENAVNIDFNSATFQQGIDKLDKSQAYLVYCRTGHRSQGASELMEKAGFKNVYNMLDGIVKWQTQNFPVKK